MASLQDPVLGYHVAAPYAARVYDAAPAPKNQVSLQGHLRKVHSISKVYSFYHLLNLKILISKLDILVRFSSSWYGKHQ